MDVGRSRANHRHGFGVALDHDFGAGAYACEQRRKISHSLDLGHANHAVSHAIRYRLNLAPGFARQAPTR
jgi:hypothetical protein